MLLSNEQFTDDAGAVNKQQHIFKYLLATFYHAKINGWGSRGQILIGVQVEYPWLEDRGVISIEFGSTFPPIHSSNSMLHLFLRFFVMSLYGEK